MPDFKFIKETKIIEVGIADTEVTVQQIYDACRDFEDENYNMEMFKVVDGSGKEELGAGVKVGITIRLIDWKLKFADRPPPDFVVCDVSGGNLVCYDTAQQKYVNPIEPAAYVTVTKTSSSSATLMEIEAIQYASFQNGIWIDVVNGQSGTAYPLGTPEEPVDNLADAKTIATARGFDTIYVIGNLTIGATDNIDDFEIIGEAPNRTTLTFVSGCSSVGIHLKQSTVTGTMGDGDKDFEDCILEDLDNIEGIAVRCLLKGTLILNGSTDVNFLDCWSGVPGTDAPILDMNDEIFDFAFRNYSGGLTIKNLTGGQSCSFDFVSGHLKLEASCTNFSGVVRGNVKVTNNAAGGTLDMTGVILPESAFEGCVHIDTVNGEAGTTYPIGTPARPVKTLADAYTIATLYGLNKFYVRGSITLDRSYAGWIFVGGSIMTDTIILNGQDISSATFENLTVTGTMVGTYAQFNLCTVSNVSGFHGVMDSGGLAGTITLGGVGSILYGKSVGLENVVIDMVGDNRIIQLSALGDVNIKNANSNSFIGLALESGKVTLENSCIGGTAIIRGIGLLVDNSSMTVLNQLLDADNILAILSYTDFIKEIEGGKWEISGDEMIFYKADNVTEIARFTIARDANNNPIMRTRQ